MPSYWAKILEVEDGDTFKVEAMKEVFMFGQSVQATAQEWVRLRDVDTHETSTEEGKEEKDFVEQWFKNKAEKSDYEYPFALFGEEDEFDIGAEDRPLVNIRAPDDEKLQMRLVKEFNNIFYEPIYGSDKKDEAQDN